MCCCLCVPLVVVVTLLRARRCRCCFPLVVVVTCSSLSLLPLLRRGRCLVVVWSLLRCYVVAWLSGCVVVEMSRRFVVARFLLLLSCRRSCLVVVVVAFLPCCRSSCVVAWALLRAVVASLLLRLFM